MVYVDELYSHFDWPWQTVPFLLCMGLQPVGPIGVWRGVLKRVEDGHRPPALRAGQP
jgi:hypothetical protein